VLCIVLCCVVLCCAVLSCAVLCFVVLCCVALVLCCLALLTVCVSLLGGAATATDTDSERQLLYFEKEHTKLKQSLSCLGAWCLVSWLERWYVGTYTLV
jgi:hypothetical protein